MDTQHNTDSMEMPTPCQKCNNWFDLNEGARSEKWFPNTVICQSCGNEEEKEIERDEEIEELQLTLSDAEWTVNDCKKRLTEFGIFPSTPPTPVSQSDKLNKDLDYAVEYFKDRGKTVSRTAEEIDWNKIEKEAADEFTTDSIVSLGLINDKESYVTGYKRAYKAAMELYRTQPEERKEISGEKGCPFDEQLP